MSPRKKTKIITQMEAAQLIRSGSAVCTSGFVGAAHPEALSAALEERYVREGQPRDLTLMYAAGQGDGKTRGLNHFARPGMLKRLIGGHWGLIPQLGRMALAGELEAYNFPQGVICHLFRDIAAGRPGCITHIGLGTFVDPRFGGGRMNPRTTEPLVELIELDGRPWLYFKRQSIDYGLIRASWADTHGNLCMEDEVIVGEVLAIAQAVHNCGGCVIAQVKSVRDACFPPQRVRVPGILVDYVVPVGEEGHDQTFGEHYNPAFCSSPDEGNVVEAALDQAFSARTIICSRATDAMRPGDIVNLGIGMPEGIGPVAARRGLLDLVTLTIESGTVGRSPAAGLSFGSAYYPEAIIDQPSMFDFYDGGGLDFSALGAAEIDAAGNVNVSRFGGKVPGIGGFMNISQTAKRLVFCGTFTTNGLEIAWNNGKLSIIKEGSVRKFVREVEQITYNAAQAASQGQEVLYVTERAVFERGERTLRLVEVAPGIDIRTDVIEQMEFTPEVGEVKLMDLRHFDNSPLTSLASVGGQVNK